MTVATKAAGADRAGDAGAREAAAGAPGHGGVSGARLGIALLGLAAAAGALSLPLVPADANPKGGQVAAGAATITPASPTQLDIVQSTDRAAINWQSFSIAPSEQTKFQQPAASSVTLNRVQAGDPSVIAGRLTANGGIVLINPSGITFAKGSQVNVNSIVATPTDISNANFMSGKMKFDKPSADPHATVVNNGTITVAQRGLAALVAPGVANSGVIQAKLGRVVVAGAQTYTVDFYGDGLISFDVGSKVQTVPVGADGKPLKSLVSNSGRIDAPGGTVLLTAEAVGGIVQNVVDVPGRITARTNGKTPGSVTIDAGAGGAARVSGTIDVSGIKPGQTGGSATVTGGSVNLAGTARINARGNSGGGTVWLGGGPHGKTPTVRNAVTTRVAKGALINASATGHGNGGKVVVWSDRTTQFGGAIKARGGPLGGDGGWVETSGKASLVVLSSAAVDAAAPRGTAGDWLLDPANLTVTTTNSNITTTTSGGPPPTDTVTPTANDATVDAAVIFRTLNAGTDVILSTVGAPGNETGDITVDATIATAPPNNTAIPILWSTAAQLTLDAAGNVSILTPISGSAGSLALVAGGTISQISGGSIAVANLRALTENNAGAAITLTNTSNAIPGNVTLSALNAAGTAPEPGTISFVDSTGFTVAAQEANGFNGQEIGVNTTSSVALQTAAGNVIENVGSIASNGGPILLTAGSGGAIQNLGTIASGGGALTLAATGSDSAVQSTGTISSGGGAITLTASAFDNGGVVDSTSNPTAGNITILADSMMLQGFQFPIIDAANQSGAVNGALIQAATASDPPPINAGTSGTVLLGPITLTSPIALNPKTPTTGLNLAQSDLDSIAAAQLQIGYRTTDDTSPFSGNIDIAQSITVNTSQVPSLLLVTSGSVTESSGATITKLIPTPPPATPLSLGAIAGGPVMLGNANQVDTVAGYVDGATTNGFTFENNGAALTIGSLPQKTLDVTFNADSVPSAGVAIGPGTNPLSGITAPSGGVTVPVIESGTTGFSLTVAAPVLSVDGPIVLTAAGTGGAITVDAAVGNATSGSMTLTAGTAGLAINAPITTAPTVPTYGVNLVSAGPITETAAGSLTTDNLRALTEADGGAAIALTSVSNNVSSVVTLTVLDTAGTALAPGTISFVDSTGFTVDAVSGGGQGGLELGANTTGSISLSAGGALSVDSLVNTVGDVTLIATGAISELGGAAKIAAQDLLVQTQDTAGAAITLASGTNAVPGDVTLSALNAPGTVPTAGAITFVDSTGFTIAAQPANGLNGQEIGVNTNAGISITGGGTITVSGAIGNPMTGSISLAMDTGDLLVDGAISSGVEIDLFANSNLALAANVSAPAVFLGAFGTITQTAGVITAATLDVFDSGGSVSLPDANAVGTLTGFASRTFLFRNDSHTLTVGCVANGDAADCGVSTNGSNIILETTNSGNLVVNQSVNANNLPPVDQSTVLGPTPGLIGLSSAGTITQDPTTGLLVGSGLEIQSVGTVSLGAANRLGANDVPQTAAGVAATPGTLAGNVTTAGQSFLFRDDRAGLTIGTVDVVDSFGDRQLDPQTSAALPAGGIAGVTTNGTVTGANIVLETTTAGNLVLDQMVNANNGSMVLGATTGMAGLASAGTVTQDPAPIVASSVGILSADRVSLGAFGGTSDLNQVGTLAGEVLNAGESFVFRNDGTSLTIGTADITDSFGARLLNPVTAVALTGPLSGVVTNNANIGLRVTTSGDLVLAAPVVAGTASIGLESAGQIRQTGGTVVGSTLEVSAVGAVSLPGMNAVPVLAGQVTGGGNSLLYRNEEANLTIGTVPTLLESGTGTPPNDQMLSVAGLSGVTSAGGNMLLETTTTGNLALLEPVDAGAGAVGLASAGTVTQDPAPIVASSLGILSADRVSLGAFGGTSDLNQVGTLAGEVLNAGESFVFRNDGASLTIGTADVTDSFGARLLNPVTAVALTGPLSGVVTNNANIGLRVTTSGNLILTQNVNAGTAGVGLESAEQIRQTAGTVSGSTLEVSAVGDVSLPETNAVPVLAGQVTGTGNSFLFRDDSTGLTIGTVPTLLESGTGTPPNDQMLSVAGLSGVMAAGGNILLETTTAGNLALAEPVNAGAGSVGLASAGTVTQDPAPIIASSVGILSADRVSLGAFGGTSDLNQVGILAAQVLNAGESFVFRNDGTSLTIGTADITDSFGARLLNPVTAAALTAPLTGVVTNNANIGLRVTTSGDLVLAAPVVAGTASIGLESAGQVQQTAGAVTGGALEVSAVGSVSLPDANSVSVLAGQTTGAGNSFLFRDDRLSLSIGTVPTLLESGTGTPPNDQMLSVAGLSGVTAAGGSIALATTTAGDLTASQNVTANGGPIALISAGNLLEAANAAVTAPQLILDAGQAVIFDDANAVGTLSGIAGGNFQFVDANALSVGSVGPVIDVAAQGGVSTSAGDIRIRTNVGDLVLASNVAAGGGNNGAALVATTGNAIETGGTVTASGLIVDAAGDVRFGITETGGTVSLGSPNNVGTLAGRASGVFGFLNGPALTVGTVPSVADVATQSGIAASPAATGDVLVQTNNRGQPLMLAGNITGGGRAIFDTAGGFAQTGAVTVTNPVFAIDTTGSGIAKLLGIVTSPNVNAGVISGLPPAGATNNPMRFGDLSATGSTLLLFADRGIVDGTTAVAQLGLSGTGSSANLFGSIAGITGPTAALIGVRNPGPEATYLFNDCIIAAASCNLQRTAFLVVPAQPPIEITALMPLPDLTAVINFVTPEAVQGRQPSNPDAPVINIYDEERLCDETGKSSEPSKERCQERSAH